MQRLTRVQQYVWLSTVPATLVVVVAAVADNHPSTSVPWLVYPLAIAVALIAEEYRVTTRQASFNLTAAIHLPFILLFTPLEALAFAALGCMGSMVRRKRPLSRIAYNTIIRIISTGTPALALTVWRRYDPQLHQLRQNATFLDIDLLNLTRIVSPSQLPSHISVGVDVLAACMIVVLLNFALDSALIASIVALQVEISPMSAWRSNIQSALLPEVAKSVLGIIAAFLAVINPLFVTLMVLPVFVAHVTTRAIIRLERETIDAITTLADAIDFRDPYTAQHSVRVADMSQRLARRLGLSREAVDEITLAARVHDLGKIGIPNDILLKNGPLTPEEMVAMQAHPTIGAEVLQKYRNFRKALPIVLHHHERYDGKGYPSGIAGNAIPLGAQIVSHADSYDAMTSDRPYRKGMRPEVAVQRIGESSGTQFDPAVTGVFVAMMREELTAAGQSLPVTGGSVAESVLAHATPGGEPDEKVRYLYKEGSQK